MIPNFALVLSFQGITLLRNMGAHWARLEHVPFDGKDPETALKALRDMAVGLDPKGAEVALILPNEQIRYAAIPDPGNDEITREVAIRADLDGATPYDVKDLTFDFVEKSGKLLVAAIANETLAEARAFAKTHGFIPVSYTAQAPEGKFEGAVYFGKVKGEIRVGARLPNAILVKPATKAARKPVQADPEQAPSKPEKSPEKQEAKEPKPKAPVKSKQDTENTTGPKVKAEKEDTKETSLPVSGFSTSRAGRAVPDPDAGTRDIATRFTPVAKAAPQKTLSARRDKTPSPEVSSKKPPKTATGNTAKPVSLKRASGSPAPTPLNQIAALRSESQVKPRGFKKQDHSKAPAGTAALKTSASTPPVLDDSHRLTIFGLRDAQQQKASTRRKMLILVSIALLLLAGLSAGAMMFLDKDIAGLWGKGNRESTPVVAALPAPASSEAPETPPAVIPESDVGIPDTAREAAPTSARGAPTPLEPAKPRLLSPEEAASAYAQSGIWQSDPGAPHEPPTDLLGDLYVASIDPIVPQFDAVALPPAQRLGRDVPFVDPGLPPQAGLVFDFDARGLVRATPQGAISPDGLRIYSGRPPVTPPARVLADTVAPQEEEGAPNQDANPLRLIRPEARPDDVIEQRERAVLGGISLNELAALRPVARPRSAQDDEAGADAPPTDQAPTASLLPLARPQNMAAIIRRSEELRPAPPRIVAPSGPTATTVARAATQRDAIDLSQITLIGIYGTETTRSALVRLPGSGNYEKVEAGDRLDGGQIRSIRQDSLIYVKNGRTITLEMPRG